MGARYDIILISLLAFAAVSGAASVNSTLAGYNVPSAVIANLTQVNISYGSAQYAALYLQGNLSFVLNKSNGYGVVLGSTSIARIMQNYTVSQNMPKANFTHLRSEMKAFQASAAFKLTQALQLTGLNKYTCTTQNKCYSCQSVGYVCYTLWYQTLGTNDSLQVDIINFENNWTLYNQSLNRFYASVNGITVANVAQNLSALTASAENVSLYSHQMSIVDMFTVPGNMTSLLGNCGFYGVSTGPWYCHSVGYVSWLGYNFTLINNINSQLAAIAALPLTSQQVLQIAVSANNTEASYVVPVIQAHKRQQLGVIINTTFFGYNAIVNNSNQILAHITNATLTADLNALVRVHANVTANFLTENFTAANRSAANAMATMQGAYATLNRTYFFIIGRAQNNTELLLDAQLSGNAQSGALASVAFQQMLMNQQLSGQITNTTSVEMQLDALNANATAQYRASQQLSLSNFARSVDKPFISMLGAYSGQLYAANVALAPAYGAVLSLIIGVVIFIIIYLYYLSLGAQKRLAMTKTVRANWRKLFASVAILVVVYAALTYSLLYSASQSTPVSAFQADVSHSAYLAIIENGTQTVGGQNCVNTLVNRALALSKKPIIAQISGTTCTVGNVTKTRDYCMNFFAYSDIPSVLLTNNNTPSIRVYSLYGSQLAESGNSSVLGSCYASLLLG